MRFTKYFDYFVIVVWEILLHVMELCTQKTKYTITVNSCHELGGDCINFSMVSTLTTGYCYKGYWISLSWIRIKHYSVVLC